MSFVFSSKYCLKKKKKKKKIISIKEKIKYNNKKRHLMLHAWLNYVPDPNQEEAQAFLGYSRKLKKALDLLLTVNIHIYVQFIST